MMNTAFLLGAMLVGGGLAFVIAYLRSRRQAADLGGIRHLSALPVHYAVYASLWCTVPAIGMLSIAVIFGVPLQRWLVARELAAMGLPGVDIRLMIDAAGAVLAGGPPSADTTVQWTAARLAELRTAVETISNIAVVAVLLAGACWALAHQRPNFPASKRVERMVMVALFASSAVAVLCTIGIVMSVLFESLRFFAKVPVHEFLFGLHWSPQTALRSDQVGASGSFGVIPLIVGTGMISLVAMAVAVPVGLMSAIYLSEYGSARLRRYVKPGLEVLAGIPTVVYGFFAALTVAPLVRDAGTMVGLTVSAQSALAAGLVMGVMIIPFVSSLSEDIIHAVPDTLREGALGLGATHSEMIRQVVLPAALPGVVGSIMLAISRAVGETMIVVMAAGLIAKLSFNPLDSATTFTVQIVTLLVGDQEFDSAKTLAAFALGLLLFVITLILNLIALQVVRRYREAYE